jgi:hypothetical protein
LDQLTVIFYSTYVTTIPYKHDDTFHANKFVKAIKGDPVRSPAAEVPVPIGGARRRLTQANRGDVFEWFGEMSAHCLEEENAVLVPIPSCKAITRREVEAGPTFRLARALGARTGCPVEPRLWWKVPMESSRRGGPRNPHLLRTKLVLGATEYPDLPIVIVDDVVTSGGHMRAVDVVLRESGAEVLFALAAASTDQEEPDQAFAIRSRSLERI